MDDPQEVEPKNQLAPPRIRTWLVRGNGATLAWLVPVVIVGITGALGSLGHPLLVAIWLAAIVAGAAGIITHVSLDPAPYALRVAQVVASIVGIGLLAILSWQCDQPIWK